MLCLLTAAHLGCHGISKHIALVMGPAQTACSLLHSLRGVNIIYRRVHSGIHSGIRVLDIVHSDIYECSMLSELCV